MASPITCITTFADGFGRWRARVDFGHTLSENDPREDFNLDRQWKHIRSRARDAVVAQIVQREQKTHETLAQATHRVRWALPHLVVIDQNIDSLNRWNGVTIGEG